MADGGPLADAGRDAGPGDAGPVDAPPAQAPVITGASPSHVARGATLVLSGSDLAGASVTIGGVSQTVGEGSASALTIDAVDDDTPTGEQDVVVTTSAGSSEPFGVEVLTALGVSSAATLGPTSVRVTFTRDLDASTVDASDFAIGGLTISDATAAGDTVELTTSTQVPNAEYAVVVDGVADEHGNGLTGARSAPFAGYSPGAPTIITISASEVVRGVSTLTIDGTNLAGAAVTIGGAAQTLGVGTSTSVVVMPVAATTPLGTQPVVATTPGGSSGSMNVDVLERLRMTSASALTATEVSVQLNRAVDVSTVEASAFTVSGLEVTGASASGAVVTLTTAPQTRDASYTVSASSSLLDLLGTPVTADTVAFTGFVPPPPTEVIVVRVGDGSEALTTAASPVFLERRAVADGALLGTLALPVSASGVNLPFTLAGSTTFDGSLSRSEDGSTLALLGFQSEPGTAAVQTVPSPRVVAVVDAADFGATPMVDTRTTIGTTFSTTAPRGAVLDGTDIWVVGGFGGLWTVPLGGSAPTQVIASPSGGRAVAIFEGQLFYSTTTPPAGAPAGVYRVGPGLPLTSTDTTATSVIDTPSAYSFAFFDLDPAEPGLDTAYIADDGQGLKRYVNTGGVWSLSATFTPAVRHTACFRDGGDVVCVSTGPATLRYLRDVGASSAGSSMTELAPAVANTNFRGVALPPVP